MAFEGLSEKLQGVFKGLKGKGTLSKADINNAIRQIKLALLEADVNFKVVKEFVATIKDKALGEEVIKSVTPGQQIVKIVNDELAALMGGANSKLTYSPRGFTVYMMVGLQGTGKTTTCGKLASYLKKEGKKPQSIVKREPGRGQDAEAEQTVDRLKRNAPDALVAAVVSIDAVVRQYEYRALRHGERLHVRALIRVDRIL